jgi:acyl-CoA synthetase (AMP-forming)/AMP-acid ligase II
MHTIAWSDQLRVLAARMGSATAVTDDQGHSLSYAQLSQQAHQCAQALLARGFTSGQSIGVWLPNSLDAVRCAYAIRLMGGAETPLSWSLTEPGLQWCSGLAQVQAVITRAERAEQVRACGMQPLLMQDLWPAQETALSGPLPVVPASDMGRILFTSGTTGKPKGVIYTHGARWVGEQMLKAAMPFVPDAGAPLLLMTPFVHGASLLTFAWCDLGGHVLLHDGVDTDKLEPLLTRGDLQAMFAPPTVLAKITQAFAGRRFTGLRCIFTGTQAMTATLYKATCDMFGPVVRITYGKSECVNPITVMTPAQTHAYFAQPTRPAGACVGWPVPGVELRIEAATAEEESEQGEVFLREPQQCAGLIFPEGVMGHDAQGWHATGDLGFIDEVGRLVLTGRVADVIKTGGYRVNPDEIEAAQTGGALYGALCVTSLASDYWGEVIITVAQDVRPGWEDEARQRVAALSKYKQPRLYVAVPVLARNAQGKVSRKKVSQAVLEQFTLIDGAYPSLQLN